MGADARSLVSMTDRHRVAPPSQWTPGHWMRQTVRVLVPRSLSTGSYRVGMMVIHEATRRPLRVVDEQGITRRGWVPLSTINVTGRAAK